MADVAVALGSPAVALIQPLTPAEPDLKPTEAATGTVKRMLNLAILDCMELPDDIAGPHGYFIDFFTHWLNEALVPFNRKRPAGEQVVFETTMWNVVNGEYPPSLDEVDAFVVSGSFQSAYDDSPWIKTLAAYLRDTYSTHPEVKIFGSCFGHQILAHALLSVHGVHVESSPNGWEIGVHNTALNPAFAARFPGQLAAGTLSYQYLHHDHVSIGGHARLPPGWMPIGSTKLCDVQGLYEPGRVLTLQGHPEMDRRLTETCVGIMRAGGTLSEEQAEEFLRLVDADDDSVLAGEVVLQFLVGS